MDPYGRDAQPDAPKMRKLQPLRPLRRLVWWLLICDLTDGDDDWVPREWRHGGEGPWRMFTRTLTVLGLAAVASLVTWPVMNSPTVVVFCLAVPPVVMWPVRVWVRVALGLRSGLLAEMEAWIDDPTYQSLKDRMWNR